MSNQPQCPVEEIELIPHPLDAWRAALNALIAVAPGDSAEIAYHLNDARKCTLICRDFSAATQGEAKLIDRLMLLGAGRIVGEQLQAQASSGSLNRRVTTRLTVVVNGTDYDVSGIPGVLVGNMLRIDPNNMPPVLSRDWGFVQPQPLVGGHQSPRDQALCCAGSSAATGLPDGASAPLQPGEAHLDRQSASGSLPATPGYSVTPVCSATRPALETPRQAPQFVPTAPQDPVRS